MLYLVTLSALAYTVFLPAPIRISVPSSTSFFNADSTEELPKLGQDTKTSCLENFPILSLMYAFTMSYEVLLVPAFSTTVILDSN